MLYNHEISAYCAWNKQFNRIRQVIRIPWITLVNPLRKKIRALSNILSSINLCKFQSQKWQWRYIYFCDVVMWLYQIVLNFVVWLKKQTEYTVIFTIQLSYLTPSLLTLYKLVKKGFQHLHIDILNYCVTVKITELRNIKLESVKFILQSSLICLYRYSKLFDIFNVNIL